jgi:type IV pilus assembly protein PilF
MNVHPFRRTLVGLLSAVLVTACSHQELRDNDDATGVLGSVRRQSPADIYVAMAAEYYKRGQLEIALQRAKQAIDVDPSNGRAHYMLALLYQKLGESQLAQQNYAEAARLEPKNPDIRNAWGAFYCSQRNEAEAQKQFREALANPLYATPEVALTNAATCARSAGNAAKAEGYLRSALSKNPSFAPALVELADMEYQQGQYKAAQALLDRYFQVAPPAPRPLLLAVRVERKLGAPKRAATYAQLLRTRFPESPEVLTLNQS